MRLGALMKFPERSESEKRDFKNERPQNSTLKFTTKALCSNSNSQKKPSWEETKGWGNNRWTSYSCAKEPCLG